MLREVDRVAARVRGLIGVDGDSGESVAPRLPSRLASKRLAVIGIGIAVIAVIAIGAWLRGDRSGAQPAAAPLATASPVGAAAPATAASRSAASVAAPTSATASGIVVVDVAGKVRHPGVYRLPAGSRVDDALQAAGGARAGVNLNGLNLAAVLVDGEQIAVGVRGAPGMVGPETPGGADSGAGALVDVNTATLEQLETLPGVGPVLGQQILDWRTQHGGFTDVDQLDNVPGIGPARLAQLRPLVTV